MASVTTVTPGQYIGEAFAAGLATYSASVDWGSVMFDVGSWREAMNLIGYEVGAIGSRRRHRIKDQVERMKHGS